MTCCFSTTLPSVSVLFTSRPEVPHFALTLVGARSYPLQIRWQYSCNRNILFLVTHIFSGVVTLEVEVFHA